MALPLPPAHQRGPGRRTAAAVGAEGHPRRRRVHPQGAARRTVRVPARRDEARRQGYGAEPLRRDPVLPPAQMTDSRHTFVCGATRSGKSEAELARLVPLAQVGESAVVLLDPYGTLARKFLPHLDLLGLTGRVIYDRLADT